MQRNRLPAGLARHWKLQHAVLLDRLKKGLCDMTRRAGFEHFVLVELPRGDRTGFAQNLVTTNWPEPLVSFYKGADLFYRSHVANSFRKTILPVFLHEEAFAEVIAATPDRRLDALVRTFRLCKTFAFTLYDIDMRQYVFAFSGTRDEPSPEETHAMVFSAIELLETYGSETSEQRDFTETLSRRELECLRWSAAGKSSDEMAIIMSLSSHTVTSYLKTAMRKLETVNRMQAVAKAYRLRLI